MNEPQPQRIIVTIASDGTVTAETKGLQGAACLPYIDVLEQLLEASTVDSRYTPDFDRVQQRSTVMEFGEERDELGSH